MKVAHHRLGKEMILSNATIFMAQDRNNVEEAYPGDIIGIHNHGTIKIGDTFTEKEPLKFTGIPNFAPEHFRRMLLKNPIKAKQLNKGLEQMAEEGAVQLFKPLMGSNYILGAVGVLQFDVVVARLQAEYGVETSTEPVKYSAARWIHNNDRKKLDEFQNKNQADLAVDAEGHLTFLASNQWWLERTMNNFPEISFQKTREYN